MAECRAMRVKCHTDVLWIFLIENFFERIDKAENSRGVFAFAVDARVFDEAVIGSVD